MTILAQLAPATKLRAYWMVYVMRTWGVPAVLSSGRRTAAQQAELYAQGRTKPGPIITNTLRSSHIGGNAFDVDLHATAPDDVPMELWEAFGQVGEYLGLVWGGRWTRLRDFRHFELPS